MKMTMNRLFVTMTLAALLCSGNVMARNPQKPEKRELTPAERMDASLKRLEGRLMLDEETAAKFAPLYKKYLEALRNCRPECPKEKGQKECTDAEIEKRLEEHIACERKRLDVQEEYLQKFKKILNARQLQAVMSPKGMEMKHHKMKGPRPNFPAPGNNGTCRANCPAKTPAPNK